MEDKLKFEAESVEVVQIDAPQYFTKLKVKIVKPGQNEHNLPITPEAIENSKLSLIGKPILAYFKNGDFEGHDSNEIAVGITALTVDDIFYDGEYLASYSYIWKRYFETAVEIFRNSPENRVSVSMEIDLTSYEQREDAVWITGYSFSGVTLLGKKILPAIRGADATVVEFSKLAEEFEHDKQILFSSQNKLTHFPRKGLNKPVSLAHSKHTEFDYDYALGLKAEYPSVWGSGGRVKGDENFDMWTKARLEDQSPLVQDWIREREKYGERHSRDKSVGNTVGLVKWGLTSEHGAEFMKNLLESEKKKHDDRNKAYFEKTGGEEMPYSKLSEINPSLKGIEPPITLGQANEIAKQADAIGADKGGWPEAIASFKKRYEVKDGKWVKKGEKMSEEFAKEDLGKGSALKVDKSKDKMSNTAWGEVNKTELEHKVLGASNYKSLVHDVYLIVDAGFEEKPSSSLHYPVMQLVGDTFVYNKGGLSAALGRAKAQNESEVVSKVEGLYKKLGLGGDEEDKKKFEQKEDTKPMADEKKLEEEKEKEEEKKEGESPEEEKGEGKKEEKKEEKKEGEPKGEEKMAAEEKPTEKKTKMSEFCDLEKMSKFMEGMEYSAEFAEEAKKEDGVDFGLVLKACYSAMCKMSEKFDAAEEDKKAYMSKIQEYEARFAELEKQKFAIEVESQLQDVSDVLSKDEIEECRADAANFKFAEIDGWKNKVKALGYTKTKGKKPADSVVKYALPFHTESENTSNLLFK